jgi:uncharacterized protein (TIGR01619 family)
MSRFFLFLPLWLPLLLFSQKAEHDWENYIVPLNGKPVSINVDLGLKSVAPVKEDSMVIIMRIRLNQLDQQGMPRQEDMENLLNIEDRLVEYLARQCGAVFAGRFTQRGIREFYFYAPDTLGYRKALNQAMQPYSIFEWLAQAKMDKGWTNYFEVLYPSDLDFLRIQSKRKLAKLTVRKGEKINISHFLSFSDIASMNRFLSGPDAIGFSIEKLPAVVSAQTGRFELLLSREEKPYKGWIEGVIVPLFRKVSEYGGIYRGWEGNMP